MYKTVDITLTVTIYTNFRNGIALYFTCTQMYMSYQPYKLDLSVQGAYQGHRHINIPN